ncbi:hypothetical protein OF83DRAFT_1029869, partial [Amylostereum chailletii]
GMWVLRSEDWLDNQHGHKELPRWTGPYIVHRRHDHNSFILREIDGTVMRGHVSGHRLKLFYYR